MKYDKWKIPYTPSVAPEELVAAGLSPLLAKILALRGCGDAKSARDFLSGGVELLPDPMLLPDMDRAVSRIRAAVESGERVAVYGDYDVDGITSTCLLTSYLRSLGLNCEPYIPDRMGEGYGLNSAAVSALAERGATLIITVDCGITGLEETRHAGSLGVDMIITDHHECPETLPEAVAVVNPKRRDSAYPNAGLAGVGVVFKLICALDGSAERCLERYCDLVAVGTVADVMPLVGENRVITRAGLEKLGAAPAPGLRALINEAGLGEKRITAGSIGFSLAPRINAAGRLGLAPRALELLMSEDEARGAHLASELCRLNSDRRKLELDIWTQALDMLGDSRPEHPIVLSGEGWHQGVIGIVASRLAEAFAVPVVMICLDGEAGKGSCRSFGGFNLFEALSSCGEYLVSFGGHAMAAGLNIEAKNIPVFREALARYYDSNPPTRERVLDIDLRVCRPGLLSIDSVASLDRLEPCGSGNPAPVLCITGAELTAVTPIGGGKHLRLRARKFGTDYECVFFGQTADGLGASRGDFVDLAFSPQINEFRRRKSVQLLITDLRPHDLVPLCRRVLSGEELVPCDAYDCLPDRGDMARLWRALVREGGFTGSLYEFGSFLRGTGLYEPKACAGLRALSELSLIMLSVGGDSLSARIIENAPKAELSRSPFLRELQTLSSNL